MNPIYIQTVRVHLYILCKNVYTFEKLEFSFFNSFFIRKRYDGFTICLLLSGSCVQNIHFTISQNFLRFSKNLFFLNVLFYYPFFIIVLFEYTLFSKRVALSFSSTFFLLPRDLNFNLEICWSKYFVTFLSLYRFPFLFKNAVCVYIYIYQLDVSFNL